MYLVPYRYGVAFDVENDLCTITIGDFENELRASETTAIVKSFVDCTDLDIADLETNNVYMQIKFARPHGFRDHRLLLIFVDGIVHLFTMAAPLEHLTWFAELAQALSTRTNIQKRTDNTFTVRHAHINMFVVDTTSVKFVCEFKLKETGEWFKTECCSYVELTTLFEYLSYTKKNYVSSSGDTTVTIGNFKYERSTRKNGRMLILRVTAINTPGAEVPKELDITDVYLEMEAAFLRNFPTLEADNVAVSEHAPSGYLLTFPVPYNTESPATNMLAFDCVSPLVVKHIAGILQHSNRIRNTVTNTTTNTPMLLQWGGSSARNRTLGVTIGTLEKRIYNVSSEWETAIYSASTTEEAAAAAAAAGGGMPPPSSPPPAPEGGGGGATGAGAAEDSEDSEDAEDAEANATVSGAGADDKSGQKFQRGGLTLNECMPIVCGQEPTLSLFAERVMELSDGARASKYAVHVLKQSTILFAEPGVHPSMLPAGHVVETLNPVKSSGTTSRIRTNSLSVYFQNAAVAEIDKFDVEDAEATFQILNTDDIKLQKISHRGNSSSPRVKLKIRPGIARALLVAIRVGWAATGPDAKPGCHAVVNRIALHKFMLLINDIHFTLTFKDNTSVVEMYDILHNYGKFATDIKATPPKKRIYAIGKIGLVTVNATNTGLECALTNEPVNIRLRIKTKSLPVTAITRFRDDLRSFMEVDTLRRTTISNYELIKLDDHRISIQWVEPGAPSGTGTPVEVTSIALLNEFFDVAVLELLVEPRLDEKHKRTLSTLMEYFTNKCTDTEAFFAKFNEALVTQGGFELADVQAGTTHVCTYTGINTPARKILYIALRKPRYAHMIIPTHEAYYLSDTYIQVHISHTEQLTINVSDNSEWADGNKTIIFNEGEHTWRLSPSDCCDLLTLLSTDCSGICNARTRSIMQKLGPDSAATNTYTVVHVNSTNIQSCSYSMEMWGGLLTGLQATLGRASNEVKKSSFEQSDVAPLSLKEEWGNPFLVPATSTPVDAMLHTQFSIVAPLAYTHTCTYDVLLQAVMRWVMKCNRMEDEDDSKPILTRASLLLKALRAGTKKGSYLYEKLAFYVYIRMLQDGRGDTEAPVTTSMPDRSSPWSVAFEKEPHTRSTRIRLTYNTASVLMDQHTFNNMKETMQPLATTGANIASNFLFDNAFVTMECFPPTRITSDIVSIWKVSSTPPSLCISIDTGSCAFVQLTTSDTSSSPRVPNDSLIFNYEDLQGLKEMLSSEVPRHPTAESAPEAVAASLRTPPSPPPPPHTGTPLPPAAVATTD